MTKKNFITLILSVIGGLLFSIGICMCLIPEWNAFTAGVVLSAIGLIFLLVLFIFRWKADGRRFKKPNMKVIGLTLYTTVSTLIFGMGMCMILIWSSIIWGILVGITGILLLLFLIPLFKGLK